MIRTVNEIYEEVVNGRVDPNNLVSSYCDLVRTVHEMSIRLKALEAAQPKERWAGHIGTGV